MHTLKGGSCVAVCTWQTGPLGGGHLPFPHHVLYSSEQANSVPDGRVGWPLVAALLMRAVIWSRFHRHPLAG